jgi:hypothetical protein
MKSREQLQKCVFLIIFLREREFLTSKDAAWFLLSEVFIFTQDLFGPGVFSL